MGGFLQPSPPRELSRVRKYEFPDFPHGYFRGFLSLYWAIFPLLLVDFAKLDTRTYEFPPFWINSDRGNSLPVLVSRSVIFVLQNQPPLFKIPYLIRKHIMLTEDPPPPSISHHMIWQKIPRFSPPPHPISPIYHGIIDLRDFIHCRVGGWFSTTFPS